jgi:hypothetical protein
MNIDRRWLLPLAVAAIAATGAAVAWKPRRGLRRTADDLEHTPDLRSWENEGGNLAPVPLTAALSGARDLRDDAISSVEREV